MRLKLHTRCKNCTRVKNKYVDDAVNNFDSYITKEKDNLEIKKQDTRRLHKNVNYDDE